MKSIAWLGTLVVLLAPLIAPPVAHPQTMPDARSITVYQEAGWGCCGAWVGHLQANGFKVERKNVRGRELINIKVKNHVPEKLRSCHTALVQGYVIEGHVPADLIHRLLKEKPAVLGLAVPGMPVGSPGMEGGKPERYDVFTFDRNGKTAVYARR
jgi:hypothetical protein